MSLPTPEEMLVELYATFGPYVEWTNGNHYSFGCRSCNASYKSSDYSKGLRHDQHCPMKRTEMALYKVGYRLQHIHAETIGLVQFLEQRSK